MPKISFSSLRRQVPLHLTTLVGKSGRGRSRKVAVGCGLYKKSGINDVARDLFPTREDLSKSYSCRSLSLCSLSWKNKVRLSWWDISELHQIQRKQPRKLIETLLLVGKSGRNLYKKIGISDVARDLFPTRDVSEACYQFKLMVFPIIESVFVILVTFPQVSQVRLSTLHLILSQFFVFVWGMVKLK